MPASTATDTGTGTATASTARVPTPRAARPAMTWTGRRWVKAVAALALMVAATVVLRATWFRPRVIAVDVAVVALGTVEDVVANSQAATVRTRRRARIGAEAIGTVSAVRVREGQRVRAGDVIVELDRATAERSLELSRTELESARAAKTAADADARLARQEHDRVAPLVRDGLLPRERLDQSRARLQSTSAALETAVAGMERARAQVRLARDAFEHLRMLAPFDGVVSQRFVEVGEPLITGQPVAEVLDPDRLYVSAPIDESDMGRLRPGLPARVTLDAYPGREWSGTVTRLAPFVSDVEEQNRTREVEIEVRPGVGAPVPVPGASADVEVVLGRRDGVVRAPTLAISPTQQVLVLRDGRAVARRVTTGLHNWEWTEIRSGLAVGDQIITSLDAAGVVAGARVARREPAEGSLP